MKNNLTSNWFIIGVVLCVLCLMFAGIAVWQELYEIAGILAFCFLLELAALLWMVMPENDGVMQKWVVIVREAKAGEFGGTVTMKSVKRSDDWRVCEAATAAEAVADVLCAGEVPVMWRRWEDLTVVRRFQLTVRDFVRGFF